MKIELRKAALFCRTGQPNFKQLQRYYIEIYNPAKLEFIRTVAWLCSVLGA